MPSIGRDRWQSLSRLQNGLVPNICVVPWLLRCAAPSSSHLFMGKVMKSLDNFPDGLLGFDDAEVEINKLPSSGNYAGDGMAVEAMIVARELRFTGTTSLGGNGADPPTMITAARLVGQQAYKRSADHRRRLCSDRRGISSVQFILVHAANEAARFAMVRRASSDHVASEEDIVALVKGRMVGLDGAQAAISVNWTPESKPGGRVTVNVDYPHTLSALGLGTVNLNGSSSTFITH